MKNILNIFSLWVLVVLLLLPQSFANDIYDDFKELIGEGCTQIDLERLSTKHMGQLIDGWAYVKSVSRGANNRLIVHAATKRDLEEEEVVLMTLYVRKFNERDASRFKSGHKIRFSGEFGGLRMKSLVIIKAILIH